MTGAVGDSLAYANAVDIRFRTTGAVGGALVSEKYFDGQASVL